MNSTASPSLPELTLRDIQDELKDYHRHHHRVLTTALAGTGPSGERLDVEVTLPDRTKKTVTFETAAVSCELELRQALVKKPKDIELAILVGYSVPRLVDDLQGRVAGGRLCHVERGRRLARILNAERVSFDVERTSALREALLVEPIVLPTERSIEARAEQAWRALLVTFAGFADEQISEATLIARLASSVPNAKTVEKLSPKTALGAAWLDFLQASGFPLARVAWRSWIAGEGKLVLALSFLVQAAHGSGSIESHAGVRAILNDKLTAADPTLAVVTKPEGLALRERMSSLADRVALLLPQSSDTINAVAMYADQLVHDDETKRALGRSRFLPSAWDAAEQRIATALRTVLTATKEDADKARAAVLTAKGALEELSQHELKRLVRGERLPRARMATRIAAYLLMRRTEPDVLPSGASETLYSLAQDYVRHGGLLDWARSAARMSGAGPLEDAVNAVLAAADEQRQADNKRFAQGLVHWVSSGLPSKHGAVVPIHEAVAQCVVPFLRHAEHRRALVVLLDGMSHSNLAALLDDLETKGYGVLRDSQTAIKPVLAALPSLTEYSRSAFFAGERIMKEADASTARDPQRFAAHKKLDGFGARLMLKTEVDRGDGHLSEAALALIKSESRLVGVVLNAIDEHLKSSRQVALEMKVGVISAFDDLLRAATNAGRAIVLCADHGHVVNNGLDSVGPAAEGARWRALREGDVPSEHEVVLSKEHAPVPRGHDRVAMLWGEKTIFGAPSHFGTHGGASMPEVIAPLVWIGASDLGMLRERDGFSDAGLEVGSLPKPDWWNIEVSEARVVKTAAPAEKTAKAQMPLFPVAPPAARAEAVAEPASLVEWKKLLLGYKPFKNRTRRDRLEGDVALVVAWLADYDGKLSRDVFAQKVRVLPQKVPAVVAMVQEWINIDGEPLLEFERETGRIVLRHQELRRILEE